MKNIAIFASGNGTNFSAIAKEIRKGALKVNLALLVCDNPQAQVLVKAQDLGVKAALMQRKDFASKQEFEGSIVQILKEEKIDLVIMAGFMRMLSAGFVKAYKNRIINIHPALLPSFKGAHAIKDAFDYGVKVTGVTVHFVDEEMDHGAIILQEEVLIKENDTLAALEERIHKVEHRLYPKAINLIVRGKLKTNGRKVRIKSS